MLLITVETSVLLLQLAAGDELAGADGHDGVAVHHLPLLVPPRSAVGIAVQRQPHLGPVLHHRAPRFSGCRAPHLWLMFLPVRLDAQRDHLAPSFLQHPPAVVR